MSRGQVLFALDEDVDKEDVLYRLLVNNEVLLADISYIAGYNSSYHHENMVELVSDKCYLRNGSKKKINAKWIKITKVYNGFPKDYEFYHTKLS